MQTIYFNKVAIPVAVATELVDGVAAKLSGVFKSALSLFVVGDAGDVVVAAVVSDGCVVVDGVAVVSF